MGVLIVLFGVLIVLFSSEMHSLTALPWFGNNLEFQIVRMLKVTRQSLAHTPFL